MNSVIATLHPWALLALLFASAPAVASPSSDACGDRFVDSLPALITAPGTWCLRKDLSTSIASGAAIAIRSSNVTFECNGHRVSGLPAGRSSVAVGIRVEPDESSFEMPLDVVIRGCHLRGFETGIWMQGAGLVEDNRIEGSLGAGLWIAATSTIRRNLVTDTGGADRDAAIGIHARGDSDVLDNTVDTVVAGLADASPPWVEGIAVRTSAGGTVRGNRIRGLSSPGTVRGVNVRADDATTGVLVADNHISGLGTGVGIDCAAYEAAVTRDNVIHGMSTAIADCIALGGDEVLP
jgi:hypothetical protein